jgi:SNF2 family DNA or RNA helicase
VVIAEPTSVPGQFTQASERVYRLGQKRHVTFFILRVRGTVWPKVVDAMRGKMRMGQVVTKDKTQMLSELLGE